MTDHEECAAIHLIDQAASILHVASVLDNGSLVYRAKSLCSSPASIIESPDYHHGGAFSVSFGHDAEAGWSSDSKTTLEEFIAEILISNSALTNLFLTAGHSNVNAWLEDSTPVSYMSVNTGKRYSSADMVVDFVTISGELARKFQADPCLGWTISSL